MCRHEESSIPSSFIATAGPPSTRSRFNNPAVEKRIMKTTLVVAALGLAMVSATAQAGSALTYDRDGKVRHVVRSSPSGYIVYNHQGHLVRVVREPYGTGTTYVDDGARDVVVIGSSLDGGVAVSGSGVGFE